jgi:uncharacterized protein
MPNNATAKTKSALKPHLLLALFINIGVLGFGLFSLSQYSTNTCSSIAGQKVCIETVSSPKDQQTGMSKYSSYFCGRGMLFDFGKVGNYGIWMKDMKISLDIAWLDESKKIIKLEKNVSPDTYPQSFGDGISSRYVLEVLPGCYELGVGSRLDN